jgi:hypothetical protein
MSNKIWLILCAVTFIVVSGSIIRNHQDKVIADNSSQDNQSSTTIKSNSQENLPASVKASSTDTEDKDQRFLSVIDSSASSEAKKVLEQIPDYKKIAFGKEVCQNFSKGMSFQDFAIKVAQTSGNDSTTAEIAGRLAGAGVGAYCPEYSYKVH